MSNPAIGYSVGISANKDDTQYHPLLETPELREFLDQHLPLSDLTLESPDAADGFSEFKYPINYPDISKRRRLNVISWPLQGAQVWAEYWTILSRADLESLKKDARFKRGWYEAYVKIVADSEDADDPKTVFWNRMYIAHQTFFSLSRDQKENDLARVCFVDQRYVWQHVPAVQDWGFELTDNPGKWYHMQKINTAKYLSTGGDCLENATPTPGKDGQVRRPFGYPDYYKFRRNSTISLDFAAWMDAVAYGTGGRVLANFNYEDPEIGTPEIVAPFIPEIIGTKAKFHRNKSQDHYLPTENLAEMEDHLIYGAVTTNEVKSGMYEGILKPEVYIQSERGDYELTSDGLTLGAFVRDRSVHPGLEFDDAPTQTEVMKSYQQGGTDRILLSGAANCPDGNPCEGPNSYFSASMNGCQTCNPGEVWNESERACEPDTPPEDDDRGRRVFSPGCNTQDCMDADFETIAKNIAKVYWEQFRYTYDLKFAGIPTWNATWYDWLAEIHVGRLRDDSDEYDVGLRIQSAPIGLWPKSLWISTQAWKSTDDTVDSSPREAGFNCIKDLPQDISCVPGYVHGIQQVLIHGTDGCLMWVEAEIN